MPAAMSAEPPRWICDQSVDETQKLVLRKTTVMRIQNRLQQRFGQDLKPGERVWEWSYETDPMVRPMLVRASVRLAKFGKEFHGRWVHTHRDAQLDACVQVEQYLDHVNKT